MRLRYFEWDDANVRSMADRYVLLGRSAAWLMLSSARSARMYVAGSRRALSGARLVKTSVAFSACRCGSGIWVNLPWSCDIDIINDVDTIRAARAMSPSSVACTLNAA